MKNILLTLAATAALMVGGMTFADTADAQSWRGRGGYYGSYYRPYYRSNYAPRYYSGYYAPRYYSGYYAPRYYGRAYYAPRYYRAPGVYLSTPRAGFYFY
jgi:hypothetical protein